MLLQHFFNKNLEVQSFNLCNETLGTAKHFLKVQISV